MAFFNVAVWEWLPLLNQSAISTPLKRYCGQGTLSSVKQWRRDKMTRNTGRGKWGTRRDGSTCFTPVFSSPQGPKRGREMSIPLIRGEAKEQIQLSSQNSSSQQTVVETYTQLGALSQRPVAPLLSPSSRCGNLSTPKRKSSAARSKRVWTTLAPSACKLPQLLWLLLTTRHMW